MFIKSLLLLLWSFTVDAAITPDLGSLEVCAGFNINFNWTYDNIADLFLATWSKGVTQVVSKSGTSAAIIQPGFDNKFEYISNGAIKLLDAVLADDGSYTFSVTYIGASGIPPDDNTASLTVLDPPDAPTGNCTSGTPKECTCRTTGLGTPPATLQIKIDGVLKTTATATATLDKTVDCCVVGDSVKCMPENTDGDTEYCVNVPETPVAPEPTCEEWKCYILFIVNLVVAIVFVLVHICLICCVVTIVAKSTTAGVIRWKKGVGDKVVAEEVSCDIKTDKNSISVRSTVAGVVEELLVQDGNTVQDGAQLCKIRTNHHLAVKKINDRYFVIKVVVPGVCICVLMVVLQLIIYFTALEDCDRFKCLGLPILLMMIKDAAAVGIIALFVYCRDDGQVGNAPPNQEELLQRTRSNGPNQNASDIFEKETNN